MISFAKNSIEALDEYRKNGFFIEENVLTDDECSHAIKMGLLLDGAKKGDYKPCMQPHRQNPEFLQYMKKTQIVQVMKLIMNGDVDGVQTEFFYTVPGTNGFAAHQDNFFVEAPNEDFASAWIALVDVDFDKGSLYGYPGSHKEGMLPTRRKTGVNTKNQDPNSNNEETIVPDTYEKKSLNVKRGSVVFLHGAFVHGSNPNLANEPRYVLLCTYIKKGSSFRVGRYAQRTTVSLY